MTTVTVTNHEGQDLVITRGGNTLPIELGAGKNSEPITLRPGEKLRVELKPIEKG